LRTNCKLISVKICLIDVILFNFYNNIINVINKIYIYIYICLYKIDISKSAFNQYICKLMNLRQRYQFGKVIIICTKKRTLIQWKGI